MNNPGLIRWKACWLALAITVTVAGAHAAPGPRYEAGAKKSGAYRSEGFFAGGSKEVTSVRLKDVRRADSQEGFERVVFDLEDHGERVPYFQVQAANGEGRVVVSIWADTQYDFDAAKVAKAFSKSRRVRKFRALPRLEDGLSIFELSLSGTEKNTEKKLEAFYLTDPSRIIVDLQ
ncbi:MAG: hypothetical protein HYW49_12790 [Deltaproteobacteria bacterium]|nr:hypothetical protein [Deltaproteobacteria bacterium]